jgi:hypothetical protein
MCRLLLPAVALALFVPSGLGHATSAEHNIEIVAIDLAGRQTNQTHNRPLMSTRPWPPDGTQTHADTPLAAIWTA